MKPYPSPILIPARHYLARANHFLLTLRATFLLRWRLSPVTPVIFFPRSAPHIASCPATACPSLYQPSIVSAHLPVPQLNCYYLHGNSTNSHQSSIAHGCPLHTQTTSCVGEHAYSGVLMRRDTTGQGRKQSRLPYVRASQAKAECALNKAEEKSVHWNSALCNCTLHMVLSC